MSKAWFALAVVAVVGVFCLALGQEQPPTRRERVRQQESAAQPPEGRGARGVPRGQVGRYQMAIRDGAQPSARPYVVVCDTTTGRCWVAGLTPGGGQGWRDLGGPGGTTAALEAPRLNPPVGAAIDGDAPPRLQPLPPAFGGESPRAADLPPALPPPAVIPPTDAIPALPSPRLPNDTPRALPPAGELPPRLPGETQPPPGRPT
jgi:hypothetical protein